MNFKNDKPEFFEMMGDYYRLLEGVYGNKDLKNILDSCDGFLQKWEPRLSGWDKVYVWHLVNAILETINKEGLKNGQT